MEGIEHQQGVLQLLGCCRSQFAVVEQRNQGGDVVAALHGAEQFDGVLLVDQWGSDFAFGNGREETGLDVGGFVDAWRHAVGDQVEENGFFANRRVLQQLDQACGLFGVQREGRQALGGTFCYVFTIGFKHGISPDRAPRRRSLFGRSG
ncbi:hypothetical protein D3C85_1443850 [compost metagenome]